MEEGTIELRRLLEDRLALPRTPEPESDVDSSYTHSRSQSLDLALPSLHTHQIIQASQETLQPRGNFSEIGSENEPDDVCRAKSSKSQQPPIQKRTSLPRQSIALRKVSLILFLVCILLIIIALEILRYVSDQRQGLARSDESKHYLWTYGPTAIFALLSVFWARVQYQIKVGIPWKLMATRPQLPENSLFLDYLSPWTGACLYHSTCNGHWPVVAAVLGATFITLSTIVSTGLFTLAQMRVTHNNVSLIVTNRFDATGFNSGLVDGWPTLAASALLAGNLSVTYPPGVDGLYAIQSFNLAKAPLGTHLSTRAVVEAFSANMSCEVGNVLNTTIEAWSYDEEEKQEQWILKATVESSSCNSESMRLDAVSSTADNAWSNLFGTHQLVTCLDGLEANRMVVLTGFVEVPTDLRSGSSIPLDSQQCNATVLFCSPYYHMEQSLVDVSITGAILNVEPQATAPPLSISGWDVLLAFESSVNNSMEHEGNLNFDGLLGWLRAISPQTPSARYLDATFLENLLRRVFQASSSLMAQKYLAVHKAESAKGSYESLDLRLQVRATSVRLLEGFLTALSLCSIYLILTSPSDVSKSGLSSPVNLPEVLVRSSLFMSMLSGWGTLSLTALRQHFLGSFVVRLSGRKIQLIDLPDAFRGNHETSEDPVDIQWWQPFMFGLTMECIVLTIPILAIITLEVVLLVSDTHGSLGEVSEDGYTHYSWTLVPAALMTIIKLMHESLAFPIQQLDRFHVLKDCSSDTHVALLQDHLAKSSIEVMLAGLLSKRFAVAATAISTLLAPFLAIAVSGLFDTVPRTHLIPASVHRIDEFNLPVQSPDMKALSQDTVNAANLLVQNSMGYPTGTCSSLIIPGVALNVAEPGSINMTNATLTIKLPALRPRLECSPIENFRFIVGESTLDSAPVDFAYPALAGCHCLRCSNENQIQYGQITISREGLIGYEVETGQRMAMDATGWLDSPDLISARENPTAPCPNFTIIYGNAYNGSNELYAASCVYGLQEVDVDVTYRLPALSVQSCQAIEDSARKSAHDQSYMDLIGLNVYIGYYGSVNHPDFQPLILAALNGSDPENTALNGATYAFASGAEHVYDIFMTQFLSATDRVPASNNTIFNGTISDPNHTRLVQSAISTRILQGLLTAMTICAAVAMYLFDTKELVPNNPSSIAAQASLYADSKLLSLVKQALEDGCKDEEAVLKALEGHMLSLGWWSVPDHEQKRFGIDVGKAESSPHDEDA